MARRVGVCSWSLKAKDPAELASGVRACGLSAVQLALLPLARGEWKVDETRRALKGISILSGMLSLKGEDYSTIESITATGGVRPDTAWPENLKAAQSAANAGAEFGLKLVTFHAGFLPHDGRVRAMMLDRLREVAGIFHEKKIAVGLETGQESAEMLLTMLDELKCPNVGVNFDPANMVLYGTGDPVAALERVAPVVMQVHIKDAVRSKVAGEWGEEVPAGKGDVDWRRFFAVLNRRCPDCELVIERESGDSRVADVRAARVLIASIGR